MHSHPDIPVVKVNFGNRMVFLMMALFSTCSIQYVLGQIDNCIQYGEDADVKVKDFDPPEDDE